jgi:hypothetical protein
MEIRHCYGLVPSVDVILKSLFLKVQHVQSLMPMKEHIPASLWNPELLFPIADSWFFNVDNPRWGKC